MKILGLWVSEYSSGSTDERFVKPLKNLGHEVRVLPLETMGMEGKLLKEIEEWKPDILLHVPYSQSVRAEIIRYISFNTKTVTISWNGDDEWLMNYPWHLERIPIYNHCITTHEPSLKKYKDIDYDRVILGQWGFSAQDWKKGSGKKDIEVYFCGARTPERDRYIRDLKDCGVPIVFEGPGYSKEKISLQRMIKNYQRAKIGLNFTLGVKENFVYTQVKARNFEIPATGTFMLTEQCPDLKRFYKENEIETFKDSESLVKQIAYFLKNDFTREKIASAGYKSSKQNSYENIFKSLLKQVKGVK